MKAKSNKFSIGNPLPERMQAECAKATKILEHLIKPRNQIDTILIPSKIIQQAKGIAVLTVLKAGFVWTGRAGTGLVVARLPDGRWSAPSAIATAGAGVGLQIGGQITDCVFILNTTDAVKAFSHGGNVTLGGNLSVCAGPVGRTGEVAGAIANAAPIFSYSKSKGLFAGMSFEGSAIITRSDANKEFYGRKVSPKEILSGAVEPPAEAESLYRVLNLKFGRGKIMEGELDGTDSFEGNNLPRHSSSTISSSLPRYPGKSEEVGLTRSTTLPSSSSLNRAVPLPPRNIPTNDATYATALYKFVGMEKGDLSFNKGDRIEILKRSDSVDDWWTGSIDGREGTFPANYVKL